MKTISKDVPACFTIESLVLRVTFELFVKPSTHPEWASAQEAPGSRWARPRSTQGPSEPTAQEGPREPEGPSGLKEAGHFTHGLKIVQSSLMSAVLLVVMRSQSGFRNFAAVPLKCNSELDFELRTALRTETFFRDFALRAASPDRLIKCIFAIRGQF